jgi:hypothetical protein
VSRRQRDAPGAYRTDKEEMAVLGRFKRPYHRAKADDPASSPKAEPTST